jgi:homoisocitrate dehydrogenase
MAYRICVIEGDGIGHEVVPAALEALRATGVSFDVQPAEAGWECFERQGVALPEATLDAVCQADATLMGVMFSPSRLVEGYRSPAVTLRQRLGLYASLRPARSWPLSRSRPGVDLLIVRENTECVYARPEERRGDDMAVVERVITRQASERIGRKAAELAAGRRKRLTIMHKANIFPLTCGLFRDAVRQAAQAYPDVQVEEVFADTLAMRLLREPERFDVIVTTNLFGDIISGEAAMLCGGIGLAPSASLSDTLAVFAPVHGSAPDIAGRGVANPMASMLAGAMLLAYLGERDAAERLTAGVEAAIHAGAITPDLGGRATTNAVTDAVISAMQTGRPAQAEPARPPALPPWCALDAEAELAFLQDDSVLLEPLPDCSALEE